MATDIHPNERREDDLDARTKLPFLSRVRIRGYKSIGFCDVSLQPLTILVGRNASGKSNFLDALAFLRDVLAVGTDEAVRMHGGRRAILNRSMRGHVVSIRIIAKLMVGKDHFSADYTIKIVLRSGIGPVIDSEHAQFTAHSGEGVYGFAREGKRVRSAKHDDGHPQPDYIWDWPSRSCLDHLYDNWSETLGGYLRSAKFYNFSPEAIRRLYGPTPGTFLDRDGGNLASVTRSLNPSARGRVRAYLSAIVAEVDGFKVVNYGDYETIRFLLRTVVAGKKRGFDAASMSDGTLRAMAALVAGFQSGHSGGPTLIGIEEPETALHPAAMRALVDALDEATEHTQLLVTTHSADLLGDRTVHPSQILVVRMQDGLTQITPVDAASREIVKQELYTLADLQRQDLIDLDEADLRRQDAAASDREGE